MWLAGANNPPSPLLSSLQSCWDDRKSELVPQKGCGVSARQDRGREQNKEEWKGEVRKVGEKKGAKLGMVE